MSKYWPKRSSPEGFSIEKLAKKCRERLSEASSGNNSLGNRAKSPNQLLKQNRTYIHWANRDFLEYHDAA